MRRVAVVDVAEPSRKACLGRCRVVVSEDALKKMKVTRSWQSLRMMTLKSRCNRTVKDETSHWVCQTPGQLGTNVRTSVANTAQTR
uniref:Uncharacterized protein n=1 Tax=Oryza barthii TaxID=65489 RepID=A0A0D3GGE7_9ORYZ